MLPNFLLVSLLFLTFLDGGGGGGLELIIYIPIMQKIRNLRYSSGNSDIKKTKQLKTLVKLVFSLSILCVNLLYRNRCLIWNNKEISECEIETWKIVLNTYVLR